jgi:hypothetical protein
MRRVDATVSRSLGNARRAALTKSAKPWQDWRRTQPQPRKFPASAALILAICK